MFVPLIVRRYLTSRRGFTRVVTLFSVLGILLGVAALIMVLAVMGGFRQELITRILGLSGHMTVEVAELTLPAAETLAHKIETMPGVVSAKPYVSGQAMVSFGGRAGGAVLRGVTELPEMVAKNIQASAEPVDGDNLTLKPGEVVVGDVLARQMGLYPGQNVLLLGPQGARTMAGFIPRTQTFRIAGIFSVGMIQYDAGLIIAPLADVQSFANTRGRVSAIEVKLADPENVRALRAPVLDAAARFAPSPLEVNVGTWQETNQDFFRALQVERVTMFIILSLIVLVAAFNIISGQMMLVGDKLADIAILRTMGATQTDIRNIFFFNGMLLGGVGTLGGVLVGMIGVWNMGSLVDFIKDMTGVNLFPGDVYFLTELPSRLSGGDMMSVIAMALVLTVLASWYPAWRAAKFDPVELLRR